MPDPTTQLGEWERHLCAPVTGRKIICAFEVLAGMTQTVVKLRHWGAQRPLLIADGLGTGQLATADDADIEMLDSPRYPTLTDQVRARMQPASRLTRALAEAVERYDPAGSAAWWLSPVAPNTPLLGRPVLGGRPPSQAALEDKLIVDRMLDDIGVTRSPSVISEASCDALMRATEELLATSGADQAVWAGDSRDGINGGGDYVRWIRHLDQAVESAAFFAAHCQRVRVSPYLAGVPCSIHGIVLPDGVVVLRPVELVSLLRPESGRFFYGGMGTTWDPPNADTVEMRRLARQLGEYLHRTQGYRGAFGLDGVLTADGFRVTELNPRFSGGLTRLARAAPDAHLELVHVNALLGRDVGRACDEVEHQALGLLADNRFADVMGMSTAATATQTVEVPVTFGSGGLEAATDDDEVVGSIQWGPSGTGSFVRFTVADGLVRPGDRCAPFGVLLCEFADRSWGTGFGAMSMPADVRVSRAGG